MTAGTIQGIIFDLDGTIVEVPYDWDLIKAELKTEGQPILSHLEQLGEPEKSRKRRILEDHEQRATREAVLKEGMREFFSMLEQKGTARALVTNNSQKNTQFLVNKFSLNFDVIISRESGLWKPSAAPIKAAMEALGLSSRQCCVVGDSPFDVIAAEDAGITKIFIISPARGRFPPGKAEIFENVEELEAAVTPYL
jgi:HAD superfamily hydrolase (TIGR01549 family)